MNEGQQYNTNIMFWNLIFFTYLGGFHGITDTGRIREHCGLGMILAGTILRAQYYGLIYRNSLHQV